MKFMSIRDLRNQSGVIQRTVENENVILTSNGKPFALVVGLEESEDPAELEMAIIQARAQQAISRIRRRARQQGLFRLSMDEIDTEISAARAERSR
ncbi:MAG TPA: type II toxin-antitoxin system prevent-host-death family antitoxin [Longimicrobiaceae bacterium]